MSRSATFAIAYLMKSRSLSESAASLLVSDAHRDARPSASFREQLALFHAMGYKLDMNNAHYRRLRMAVLARARQLNEAPPESFYESQGAAAAAAADGLRAPGSRILRCRACRRALVPGAAILAHAADGAEKKGFGWLRDAVQPNAACTLHLVEPMEWMEGIEDLGATEGKVSCLFSFLFFFVVVFLCVCLCV